MLESKRIWTLNPKLNIQIKPIPKGLREPGRRGDRKTVRVKDDGGCQEYHAFITFMIKAHMNSPRERVAACSWPGWVWTMSLCLYYGFKLSDFLRLLSVFSSICLFCPILMHMGIFSL